MRETQAPIIAQPGSAAARVPAEREKVHFASGGTECAAWFYPGTNGGCVIMTGGMAVTKEPGTDRFARRFRAAGFGVLAFDYRRLGESGGRPRQVVRIADELATGSGRWAPISPATRPGWRSPRPPPAARQPCRRGGRRARPGGTRLRSTPRWRCRRNGSAWRSGCLTASSRPRSAARTRWARGPAGQGREDQPPDRRPALPFRQHRGNPPAPHLPEARHPPPRRADDTPRRRGAGLMRVRPASSRERHPGEVSP